MKFSLILTFFLALNCFANEVIGVEDLVSELSMLRSKSGPLANELNKSQQELISLADQLQKNADEIKQKELDKKNAHYDYLTQELLLANYREKHDLYLDMLKQLNDEKNDLITSGELLQEQLEDAKNKYDQLLVEVDHRKILYLNELKICQVKMKDCFQNQVVKRYQAAWNDSVDSLKIQMEMISDMGQLYHQSMSKAAKLKIDEQQYSESLKQYDEIVKSHMTKFEAESIRKNDYEQDLQTLMARQLELRENESQLQARVAQLNDNFQQTTLLIVEYETIAAKYQQKLTYLYRELVASVGQYVEGFDQNGDLISYLKQEYNDMIVEASKKLAVSYQRELQDDANAEGMLFAAVGMTEQGILPLLDETVSKTMIAHILDQKPIYSQVALVFRSELLEKLASLPNVQKIKQAYKISVVQSVLDTGRLIALEATADVSNSQMVGQSAP